MKPLCLLAFLLVPLVLGVTLQEDDLVFDDVGEETSPVTVHEGHRDHRKDREKIRDAKKHRVERLWGVPGAVVAVGHVLKIKIPKQAFGGNVDHYEVRGSNGKELSSWMFWDEAASTLVGVPSRKDLGQHHVAVKAFGKHGDAARDTFTVRVVPEEHNEVLHKDGKTHCEEDKDQTLLTILLDARFESLKPPTRVNAVENLAGFLGMHTSAFSIHPYEPKEVSSVVFAGLGNVKHRREKHITAIQWQVGCNGGLWRHQSDLVKQLREQAKDGTLTEVLQLPVFVWCVRTHANTLARNRREIGSGDFGNADDIEYDGDYGDGDYDDDDEEDDDVDEETFTESPLEHVPKAPGGRENTETKPEHPHRHHHGEQTIDFGNDEIDQTEIVAKMNENVDAIPTTTRSSSSSTTVESTTMPEVKEPTTPPVTTSVATTTPSTTTSTTTMSTTSTTTTTTEMPSTVPSTPITSPSTTTTTTTTTQPTTTSTTTPPPPPTIPTTEKIEYGVHNFPPRQDKRLQKIAVTAGKPLNYTIPADTFTDLEDGNTRKLALSLYLDHSPIKHTHWLQFNRRSQKIYGLPLEKDISSWDYELVAADSEGLNVSDRLDIHVQQHKLSRTVNHEFSIYLRILRRSEFPTNVDWELKVIQRLAELYGDSDISQITVRSIELDHDQAIFTWTNDTIPRGSECPRDQINKLLHVLVANRHNEPSVALQEALAPEFQVKRVVYQGIGQCEEVSRPDSPKTPTQEPKTNFPPIPRNQVDHINATVGQLLIFRVPEDTFFDPEDGSARNMKMSLLTIDRTPIPPHEWLQFDGKNQEFYGVPLHKDVGRKEYQLIVTDKGGVSATDGLVVVVHPAPVMHHNVEFSMTLAIPYDSFAHSALQKRNFIERLRDLFKDKDTGAISLDSISRGSTVVTWHNRTLPTNTCPNDQIVKLHKVLVKDDKTLSDRVEEVMSPDFPVMQITLTPMRICLGELTGIHSPDSYVPPVDDSTSLGASHDDYLITFVLPAIIISAMLILAAIIACVLYRRRRSGKMSVSEQDDERQSFRNKGIPVIFQDELDEKPDPGNKSPIILKEEKPPLPPPEYQKAEDGADVPMLPKENSEEPYQPPPPFATSRDNNRQNRPKPTPTYRKPPPYVPP
ncbi:dystroglycan isoform X2 [Orussus abietinus]|uniref:dystroglycan isoform X2 n=1 Tax=Orussus abietinus TaxID=222816 RepID=UPI0006265FE2|nr:dystroglycan isoform X2 [Orussus abietinus]